MFVSQLKPILGYPSIFLEMILSILILVSICCGPERVNTMSTQGLHSRSLDQQIRGNDSSADVTEPCTEFEGSVEELVDVQMKIFELWDGAAERVNTFQESSVREQFLNSSLEEQKKLTISESELRRRIDEQLEQCMKVNDANNGVNTKPSFLRTCEDLERNRSDLRDSHRNYTDQAMSTNFMAAQNDPEFDEQIVQPFKTRTKTLLIDGLKLMYKLKKFSATAEELCINILIDLADRCY